MGSDTNAAGAPVVLVTGVLTPRRGMEVAVLELSDALARERPVEIILVHGTDPGGAHVPVRALSPKGPFRRARELRDLLSRHPDAIIVVCGLWAAAHVLVAAPKVLPRAVGWEHSITTARRRGAGPRTRLKIDLAGRAYRRCRAVVAVSDEVATTLRQAWRVESLVVPNLLPAPVHAGAQAEGERRSPSEGKRRSPSGGLLMVGALVPPKNHALVLRALALLPADWSLTVAGDGPLRTRLVELADSLGLADRVTWLGHVDDVPERMAAADALLQPSSSETFGYTLLEAGAAHLPVVALDVPVVREVVPDLAPGLLVAQADPQSFAAAVRQVVTSSGAARSWDFAGADERRRVRFGREEVLAAWRRVLG